MTETIPEFSSTSYPNNTFSEDASTELSTNKQQKRVVDWAKSQFERCKQARSGTERQWYLNLAFYFGKQNVVPRQNQTLITSASGTLYTPPAPYYRVRPVINRIRPTIRTELAKLTSQKPNAFVIPASSEDRDLYAAQAGEQIWDSVYRKYGIHQVLRKALFWTLTCGTGFIKSYWDQTKVDVDSNQMGDFCYEAETPFHVFVPDLREEDLERQPYLIHAQLKSLDWVKLNFPEIKINFSETTGEQILEDSWLNMVGASSTNDQHKVLVLEVWVKPNSVSMFPQGAVFTVIGDKLAQFIMGWPYEHGKYPFAKIGHIPSGKFYCDSSIVDLIPLQREYNRTRGQIIECVTPDTEILTAEGWKSFSELTGGEIVLQYDKDSDSTCWGPLLNIHSGQYEGEMYLWDSENISACVTPNHRWFYETERGKKGEGLQKDLPEKIKIPLARVKEEGKQLFSNDEMELAGWFLADGSMHSNGRAICIYQSRNNPKFKYLENLFTRLGIQPNENTITNEHGTSSSFFIGGELGRTISDLFRDKNIPWDILCSLSNDNLESLLRGLMYGDGSFNKDGSYKVFSSITKKHADAVQFIASLLGYTTSLYEYSRPGHTATGKEYRVSFKQTKYAYRPHADKGTIKYSGLVWCPEVETGYWVARRNGKVFITGNSKNRMAKPQLAAEKGSIDPSKITSEPGQVILYTPGFNPPQPIPLQQLPSYVLQELDRILLDWADISGIHEVSQGQVPPGVSAATAISYLQEQDESKLSHTVDSVEQAIEKIAQITLSYVGQFWDASRVVKVTGADGIFDAMAFKGSDLRGNTDIKIEAGSALPTSRAAKQAMIMDFMKMGFISPDEGMEVLELGGINKIYDRLQVDKKQAQRENLKMAKVSLALLEQHLDQEMERITTQEADSLTEDGVPLDRDGMPIPPKLVVPVNTYDNHAVHIMVHNDYRKSQAFENLPEHIKELFEQHVNQHIASLEMMQVGETAAMTDIPPVSSEQESEPVPSNPAEEETENGTAQS